MTTSKKSRPARPRVPLSPEALARRRAAMADRHQRYLDNYLGAQKIAWRKQTLQQVGPMLEAMSATVATATALGGTERAAEAALLEAAVRADIEALLSRVSADADHFFSVMREQILRYQGRFGGPLNGYLSARLSDPLVRQALDQELDERMDAYAEASNATDAVEQHLRHATFQARLQALAEERNRQQGEGA